MPADRILIVDDEDSIREVVSSMLSSSGFACTQAQSGKEALALLQSGEEFELMLSDMMMPVMDGEALLAATKERFPDMPVVMVTAMHDISIALNSIRNGAYDYLLKPFDREQLLATVRRALENRRLKLENRAYQTNLEALVTARTEQRRQAITSLEQASEIVYAHQEKYDGTGYPRGLKGDDIPLGARIFSVADTLDAMTSDRPYRARLPFTVARDEIQRWSGRQFDPQVVATFLQM